MTDITELQESTLNLFNLLILNCGVYGMRGITRGIIKGANI